PRGPTAETPAAVLDQQAQERRLAGEAPPAEPQVAVDRGPGLAGCGIQRPTGVAGPYAVGREIGVGPGQDLLDAQPRRKLRVPHAAVRDEQAPQALPSRQATAPDPEMRVDRRPDLAGGALDLARAPRGPVSLGGVVRIGPGEDLRDGQRRT